MTTQESFKKRVRTRMATTGERYTTARRALLTRAGERPLAWVSEPEVGDEAVRRATGRGWTDWCRVIDSWPRADWDHASAAERLQNDNDLDGWWAQTVIGGYERITGLRRPGQMPDGTFTANKSKTVSADPDQLRQLLLDHEHRADLFPDEPTELRSRPTSKSVRLRLGAGVAVIGLQATGDGRTKVTVQHEKLPTVDDIERWKFWWSDWLEAIDQP